MQAAIIAGKGRDDLGPKTEHGHFVALLAGRSFDPNEVGAQIRLICKERGHSLANLFYPSLDQQSAILISPAAIELVQFPIELLEFDEELKGRKEPSQLRRWTTSIGISRGGLDMQFTDPKAQVRRITDAATREAKYWDRRCEAFTSKIEEILSSQEQPCLNFALFTQPAYWRLSKTLERLSGKAVDFISIENPIELFGQSMPALPVGKQRWSVAQKIDAGFLTLLEAIGLSHRAADIFSTIPLATRSKLMVDAARLQAKGDLEEHKMVVQAIAEEYDWDPRILVGPTYISKFSALLKAALEKLPSAAFY